MATGFDKIATKKVPASRAASEKVAAEVTDDIKDAVDIVIANKAAIKKMEAELKEAEATIIAHVRPQQDELAYSGQFTKSLTVEGNSGSVLYNTQDRFSVSQEEDVLKELEKLVGAKRYEEFFEAIRSISINSSVLKDEKKLQAICDACEKAGLDIGEIFDVGDKVSAKKDLDRKQYELPKGKLEAFRTLVRQNKPALK